ncbi:MAG TPA: hypothetical protein VM841_12480, partial [Actinomycetota bacterium]|nr:hypothetical protein [Actinomycetota bacterium]
MGSSDDPMLSGNGRVVAFQSDALNLAAGDTNLAVDVFAHAMNAFSCADHPEEGPVSGVVHDTAEIGPAAAPMHSISCDTIARAGA